MFVLIATLCATLFWTLLFSFCSLAVDLPISSKALWDLRNRLVSFVHGLFCIWFSVSELITMPKLGAANSEFQEIVLCWTLGYFIYDFFCMIAFGIYDTGIVLHHALVITADASCVLSGAGGTEAMMGYFVSEFTNPLLHLKEILRLLNQKNTQFYFYAEISFFLAYFFSRYLIGIPAIYLIVTSNEVILFERVAGLGLEIMFLYWGWKMWFILMKRLGESSEREKKGIRLPWTVSIEEKDE
jgi:hypothetical protein